MATSIGTYATRAAVETRIGGTFDSGENTLIDALCDQVNMSIERTTGRIMAPITSATYLYDGDGGTRLYLPVTADGTPIGGIRAISLLECQLYTNSGYLTVDSTQYFLREKSQPAAPYDALYFTDYATGQFQSFPRGFATVRITATAGWAAIPDDIVDLANAAVVTAWSGRQSGGAQVMGSDPSGPDWLSRLISPRDRETLRQYTLVGRLV